MEDALITAAKFYTVWPNNQIILRVKVDDGRVGGTSPPLLSTPSRSKIRYGICVAASLSMFVALPHVARAQTPPSFKFDFEGGSASTLTRTQNGLIPIRLLYTKGKDNTGKVDEALPREVLVSPSLFTSDTGSVNVHVSNGKCDSKNPPAGDPLTIRADGHDSRLMPVCWRAPGRRRSTQGTWSFCRRRPNRQSHRSRSPARRGGFHGLLVSGGPNRVDLTLPNPLVGRFRRAFFVTVQEKSGKTPVEGLFRAVRGRQQSGWLRPEEGQLQAERKGRERSVRDEDQRGAENPTGRAVRSGGHAE